MQHFSVILEFDLSFALSQIDQNKNFGVTTKIIIDSLICENQYYKVIFFD